MYEYRGTVERIVDGDTIDVRLDLGFHVWTYIRLRLRGVNAPEVRGPEREAGLRTSAMLRERLPAGSPISVASHKTGKYGRWIADVEHMGRDIGECLLDQGLAKPLP